MKDMGRKRKMAEMVEKGSLFQQFVVIYFKF